MKALAGWSHAETACRWSKYILDCTVIAWAHKSVEQAVEREAVVAGRLGIEAWQYSTERDRIVPGSYAIAGKPNTAAAVDDP